MHQWYSMVVGSIISRSSTKQKKMLLTPHCLPPDGFSRGCLCTCDPYITALYELPGSAYNSPDVQSWLIGFQGWDSSEVFTAQVVTGNSAALMWDYKTISSSHFWWMLVAMQILILPSHVIKIMSLLTAIVISRPLFILKTNLTRTKEHTKYFLSLID